MITTARTSPEARFVNLLDDDPLWYKHAVIYQLHVRSFCDSDGDGVGDFRGLIEKLDYLKELGVTALWVLPFYPSPLRDDGYDIADYTDVHPAYGTLRDCKEFIVEAHRRGLRVITELVLNHTSDQHHWFQRARHAPPGSNYRNFYVWSDTDSRYKLARIIFKDFETSNWAWDPVAQAYYWHRFYSHQPDLNFDNPNVQQAVIRVVDLWFKMGVDGLRLDAVPYLFQREGTTCENLPETHAFLKLLRRHVDERYSDRMLLAEANQWPEDAIAYFGGQSDTSHDDELNRDDAAPKQGDECHMAFHFPLMPRLFMSIRMEDRYPILDILQQTPSIPDDCQWAVFLRNHDELTLEMVTDEERDYMYRVYAYDRQARINLGIRRRLSPLLGNNRRKIELMNGLLFSLPGTPVLYYGDEIGMGDNVYLGDRNGVRTPMQWSGDRNAGFSRANPQRLYLPVIIDPEYHHETVNVEAQLSNTHSMLWWMRRLIALRKRYPVFGEGSLEFLHPDNPKILAFTRTSPDHTVLVVANLSRFVQCAEMDLSAYRAARPVEMFGNTKFPTIGELPYFLTLGPHSFYWFELQAQSASSVDDDRRQARRDVLPEVRVASHWRGLFTGRGRELLERHLPQILSSQRWFGGKARTITRTVLLDAIEIANHGDMPTGVIALVEVDYSEGDAEVYQVPMACTSGDSAQAIERDHPGAVLLKLAQSSSGVDEPLLLYDANYSGPFAQALVQATRRRGRYRSSSGRIDIQGLPALRRGGVSMRERLVTALPQVMKADQSNTSILYGDQAILKMFRRPAMGENPDVEMSRFLTEQANFQHTPRALAVMEYRSTAARGATGSSAEAWTLAVLQQYVQNEGDAWQYTLSALSRFFDHVIASDLQTIASDLPSGRDVQADESASQTARDVVGSYLNAAALIGERTGQMHRALASSTEHAAFSPQPVTPHDARSLYQSWRNTTRSAMRTLRRDMRLGGSLSPSMAQVLDAEHEIIRRLRKVVNVNLTGMRIRTHGDYHLGQLLYTGRDFVVIDFEGEPSRPLSERRMRRSALRDVAGMLRSFHYAASVALRKHAERWGSDVPQSEQRLRQWSRYWRAWVSHEFLRAYHLAAGNAAFLPATSNETEMLLECFVLEKALYELIYELNNRPDWVSIPVAGILELLGSEVEG